MVCCRRVSGSVALALLAIVTQLRGQDTIVVRADGPPAWGSNLQVVEELRVGELNGELHYIFGNVPPAGAAVDTDESIWVADRQMLTVRRYGSDGAYLGQIGGRGSGPGEFRSLEAIQCLSGNRIAAWDPAQQRVSIFDSGGDFVSQFRTEIGSWTPTRRSMQFDTAGVIWILDGSMTGPRWWRGHSLDGENVDSIAIPPRRLEGARWASQRYGYETMHAFAHVTITSLGPDGVLVVGRNVAYTFRRRLADGRVLQIQRSWAPVHVSRRERKAFQDLEDHFAARRDLKAARVPARKPPWWNVWVDQEGRIWVARHGEGEHVSETVTDRNRRVKLGNPPNEWWEPLRFDVISPGGRFLGTVQFPNRQTDLMVARGDRVWVLERGEYGEQYVVRYRITGSQ